MPQLDEIPSWEYIWAENNKYRKNVDWLEVSPERNDWNILTLCICVYIYINIQFFRPDIFWVFDDWIWTSMCHMMSLGQDLPLLQVPYRMFLYTKGIQRLHWICFMFMCCMEKTFITISLRENFKGEIKISEK